MKGKFLIGFFIVLMSCLDDEGLSLSEQLNKEVKKIDAFLEANAITNVIKDGTGIRMVVTNVGDAGLPPNIHNDVKINYSGRLLATGEVFAPADVWQRKLREAIYGWQYCFAMLPEGSSAIFYIPSLYGYGSRAQNGVPANSTLIFEVELESVTPTSEQNTKLASDGVAIDNYLASKSIAAETHSTGIRYVIETPGEGPSPGRFDQVKINFVAKIIPNEVQFDSGTIQPTSTFSSRVCNYIPGWQIALPMLKEGGKMKVFVPSILGYGPQANEQIPANSNLYFEIELVEIL
jgi:FKBP-type peptidyl-prolyl cis-trans isomerase FkpA